MSVALSGSTARVLVRMADQGLWSLAFFTFNVAASVVLSVQEYAALAVCTSVAFIAISIVRSGSISSRLIAGSRVLSPEETLSARSVFIWSCAATFATVAASVVWLLIGTVPAVMLSVLAVGALLVILDGPHQLLVYGSRYGSAAALSVAYFVFGAIGLGLSHRFSTLELIGYWCIACLVVCAAGWRLAGITVPWRGMRIDSTKFAWRLSAEALYSGVASQLTILVLFLLDDSEAAAGFRLGYALVFAPAFMIVQGLMPLFLKSLARVRDSAAFAEKTVRWLFLLYGLIGACAVAAPAVSSLFPGYTALHLATGYLVPVGLSVLASQVLEGVTAPARFVMEPSGLHNLRLFVVSGEIFCQLIGVTAFGIQGLIVSVISVAAVKLGISAALVIHVSRSSIQL
ncbi:hypothetical protein DK926_04865 [Rhodococcus sp. Eu-32]|uniref:hypothetical protein n=1 Tax=Rhodococcus sp. Eu-32 TaxID=1017319 RepID=UPI000F7B979D|nr:hypothetical protein [Rhodococcus sp. Eu-32]RRQ29216.1 hypothetical protein DK926_04865 [Rhodococcus sp. Eu-32]